MAPRGSCFPVRGLSDSNSKLRIRYMPSSFVAPSSTRTCSGGSSCCNSAASRIRFRPRAKRRIAARSSVVAVGVERSTVLRALRRIFGTRLSRPRNFGRLCHRRPGRGHKAGKSISDYQRKIVRLVFILNPTEPLGFSLASRRLQSISNRLGQMRTVWPQDPGFPYQTH